MFQDILQGNTFTVHMDYFVMVSDDEEYITKKEQRVLEVASSYGLEINLKKYPFLKKEIELLGYITENVK